jgi:hypothetical protein
MAPGKTVRDQGIHDLAAAREQVEEMLRRRDPFNSIEAFIDRVNLEPDVKSGLWLLAWSELSQLRRRGFVAATA